MTHIDDIISEFRVLAWSKLKLLGPYIYSLTPVLRDGLGTMAVDKYGRLYYDPDWVQTLTTKQGAYVVLHEVCHAVLQHCHRAPDIFGPEPTERQRVALNIAADIIVWEHLEAFGNDAPENGVTFDWAKSKWPSIERNSTLAALYDIINREEPEQEQPTGDLPVPKEEPESGEGEGPEQGDGPTDSNDNTTKSKGEGDGTEDSDEQVGMDGEDSGESLLDDRQPVGGGSSADGQTRDYEDEPDPKWEAFVEDKVLQEVEQKIEEHERTRGTVPGGFAEAIRARLRPQPDPFKQLTGVVGSTVSNNRGTPEDTYHRFNRRNAACPELPRLKGDRYTTPKVVCIVDTSGSMTRSCLEKAVRAIGQGVKAIGKMRVVFGDSKVQADVEVRQAKDHFDMPGRGGTCMTTLCQYAEEKYSPSAIVCVTDGGTGWPDRLKAKLIIALTDSTMTDWTKRHCKYGKIVHIPGE